MQGRTTIMIAHRCGAAAAAARFAEPCAGPPAGGTCAQGSAGSRTCRICLTSRAALGVELWRSALPCSPTPASLPRRPPAMEGIGRPEQRRRASTPAAAARLPSSWSGHPLLPRPARRLSTVRNAHGIYVLEKVLGASGAHHPVRRCRGRQPAGLWTGGWRLYGSTSAHGSYELRERQPLPPHCGLRSAPCHPSSPRPAGHRD